MRNGSSQHWSHPAGWARGRQTDQQLHFFRHRGPRKQTAERTTVPLSIRSPKAARVEAALMVADGPLTERKLLQFAALADLSEVRQAIAELNTAYDRTHSAFRLERLATGYQLLTRPQYAPWLDRVHQRQARLKLSPVAMETLSIVAYRQPLTRADVESVRGVQSGEIIKQLMDRGLVRIVGEDDSLGRPFLYGTTKAFLDMYALQNLDDLPQAKEMRRPMSRKELPADVPSEPAKDAEAS